MGLYYLKCVLKKEGESIASLQGISEDDKSAYKEQAIKVYTKMIFISGDNAAHGCQT